MQVTNTTTSPDPLATTTNPSPAASLGSIDNLGNQNTFLQLLVAQLKNQDPMQPADGTQFVTQLAQFSSLEQLIGIRGDLDTVKASAPSDPATTPTPDTPTV